ncbi:DUF885 domain-containing protein [Rheinheimera sp. MMS21-TC3]|uniref:DUF885 domain-containing protein n=1 Tax=Rheinheimera sp. MMS21-TC3 TaxID=3072790 RepID=UPI0028C4B6EF|nr:DUF885 domain-containing protein [Rheinheimera sp. MMS21-TC3]WNO61071.1 DUF885 domain-containing protein [Rheinheimera sp. MMS21-TC3]
MRKTLIALAAAGLLTACEPSTQIVPTTSGDAAGQHQATELVSSQSAMQSETARLNQWFEAKYEQKLQQSPLQMTFLGRKDKYDQIDDVSQAAEERQLAWLASTVKELTTEFDYQQLTLEAQTSYDVWLYQYELEKEAAEFSQNQYIFTQMQGIHALLPQIMINFHKVESLEDMQAYNQRLVGMSQAITELLQRAKLHAELGVRPPQFAYKAIIEQIDNLITGAPFDEASAVDSPLWADAQTKISSLVTNDKITDKQAKELSLNAKTNLQQHFLSAYTELKQWLDADIANTDVIATGVGKQPNGIAYYNHQLKSSTTTSLTADEIHQIGLDEVERLTKEMLTIKDKVGFTGSLADFFDFIKTDQQFTYPNTDAGREAYISDTEQYLAQINKQLPNYFGLLPKADLIVKRVEAFREQPGAAQHYFPGTPDGARPSIYYAHLSDMKSMPKNEMEAIAYHEGNPGHHMQISIAQELTTVPTFRTQAGFTAYSEGWGLYAELLAKEMGGYENPYSDFGRLITEMWRAVRLVVDTGLHSKGWTEQEAVEYFLAKTPIAEGAVQSEVRRYIVWPGQATAYKIGMIAILKMRANAEKELGDKFDIKAFHDTVLGGGALPLKVLEKRVNNWIASIKNAA